MKLLKENHDLFNSEIEKIAVEERIMFRDRDLSNMDLSNANVKHCDFSGSDLGGE